MSGARVNRPAHAPHPGRSRGQRAGRTKTNGTSLFAGGLFENIGKTAQASLASTLPLALAAAPPPVSPIDWALRVSPNPAAGAVRVQYDLPRAARVDVSVFDVLGRRIATPVSAALLSPGRYEASWDPGRTSGYAGPGVYFVRMQTGPRTLVQRLVLLKRQPSRTNVGSSWRIVPSAKLADNPPPNANRPKRRPLVR
ncbi:MAG TPA: T9SS type A sorting domain-containing protein [Polyangiaceae bacterium]|nr:T9SS type A sorting domain-containing protein [Polyangiaceae bacterium]